jgi:hypothetical protein
MPTAYPAVAITRYLDVRLGTLRGIANVRFPDLGLTFPDVEIHERSGRRRAVVLPRGASGMLGSFDTPDVAEAFSAAVLTAVDEFVLRGTRPA